MTPQNLEQTHEIHTRYNIVLYYGNGQTETETFFGNETTVYQYADELKRERRAQSAIVN